MIKTKNILIISSNRLGDSILSSGLNGYFNKNKYSKLTFVCGPVPSEIFKYCKNIKELIILKKKRFSIHWFILWFKLVLTKWECIIDLRGTGISFFLLSKKRYRFKKQINHQKQHKVSEVTKQIVGKVVQPSIQISPNQIFNDKKLKQIIKFKRKYKLIMIAPTANWIGKIWPSERYLELINKLIKDPYFKRSLFIFVGPSSEKHYVKKILELKNPYIFDLFGNSSLIEIFNIMKLCSLFIGNDSGLMHLATLAKIKTIGLFGPSDKLKYKPWGKGNFSISSPKSPEELMGYRGFDSTNCGSLMLGLETHKVYKKIISKFKNTK